MDSCGLLHDFYSKLRAKLREQCQQLGIDLIDLSNHQKNADCQGFLGKSGSEVSTAGTLIDDKKIESAKNYLHYAHNDLMIVAKMNCAHKEQIKLLTQKEEFIELQL